ncbi:YciI family protein [Yeosuana sp.]|uniref:YciI family protein n=1 Tax=Yeosuana sp. TaxID=2529388 RepID=UPI004054F5C5|tara:strand:- start:898 stop:1437 length:540 start_codon:yes stop_codon:yes gene_type:complete
MKKFIIYSFVFLGFYACRKVEKEVTKEGIETPQEIIKDSVIPEVSESSIMTSTKNLKEALTSKGFQIFDYVDEKTKDTILMQQYFIAFLKNGPTRSQSEEEASFLQKQHLAHLGKMYDLGYADISGPFGDNGDIRGITIYNVPTLQMADSLANADPMVKAGRLIIEMHPWWAAKGFPLR